ncbi:MAG: Ig-like domain-containing protein [Verrucomicrobia bacterium]|nr:Ig-like domain-containing protein [Verrucomicrobiota bacterium]
MESTSAIQTPLVAKLHPLSAIAGTESAVLIRWDEITLQWNVTQSVAGNGTNAVTTSLPAGGAYALVVGDTGEWAPPAPQLGQPLAGVVAPSINTGELTASGNVTPAVSSASVVPAMVTGTARLEVRHSTQRLPSGYVLRGEVTETYLLSDGSLRLTPQYEHFIVAYQRPGDQDAFTLHASFPMRPLLLFGPEQLDSATVKVDVLPESAFDGEVLDQSGGQIGDNGVRVLAGTGRLVGPSAVQLRRLDAAVFTNLVGNGHEVIAAFDLTVDRSTLSGSLSAQLSGAPTNAQLVMARVLSETGFYGLQPVERLRSDAQGNITSLEPGTGARLPGLAGSGQFVLVQVNEAQTLVEGVARNGAGIVQSNMPVSLVGLPWLALSEADGKFQLVGPAGERQLSIRDPLTGDTGFVGVTVGSPTTPVTQDLSAAARGPRVAKISPADNATRVPRVGSVVIEFNEAVNPASIVNAIQLLRPDNSAVPASVTLNLANRIVTLNAANELAANTIYRVVLAETIRDPSGLAIEGDREFSFTTVPAATRVSTAQLVIYEPGATNVPAEILNGIPAYEPGEDPFAVVVHGQPGVADPEVAVILANESTGETTTVLSKVDGSFNSVISGTEEDFISATFVNLNGTRVYVPVSRQEFDNGFVGLYPQGGILEAQSDGGPVRVYIQPESIPKRTKLKIETMTTAQLQQLLGGVTPESGSIAGSPLTVRIEGQLPTLPIQVRFPVDLATVGYPTNEAVTNVAAVLAVVQTNAGITGFEIKDQLLFTPQAEPVLRAAQGAGGQNGGVQEQITAGFLDTGVGFIAALPGGQVAQTVFFQVIMPIVLGPRPVVIKGKASSIPVEIAIALQQAGALDAAVNLQTGQGAVDMPFQLAQQMGLVQGAFGNAVNKVQGLGQIVSIGAQALQLWVVANAQPLSGTFVVVTLSGGPLNQNPGRLFPGMVYASSGADGQFLTVAPAVGAQYLVIATHPLFQDVEVEPANPISRNPLNPQGDLSLGGAVYKNFFFKRPLVSQTPPTVSIGFEPLQPAPGQPCRIQINATQPINPPDIRIGLISVGTTNLQTGLVETNVIGELTDEVWTTPTGNSAQYNGTLRVNKPVNARLSYYVRGVSLSASFGPQQFDIQFTGPKPAVPSDIPPPDTNDVHGPLVVQTSPVEGGFVGESAEITIDFNKPIDAFVTNNLSGIILSGPGAPVTPIVRLSPGQRTLVLQFPGLSRGQTYSLTLSGQSVRDLATPPQPLDQQPSTPAAESFSLNFRTPPAATAPVTGVADGRGAVVKGNRLYVLDQKPQNSSLKIYDISIPQQPRFLGQKHLIGQPRDLVVIPQYSYARRLHAKPETNDLVVVVGGDLDAVINEAQGTTVSVRGQYLWVLNVANPTDPEVLASPIVTYRVSSVVPKVVWAPPFIAYQEFGADIQQVATVNLQELIIGFNSSPTERAAFPTPERRNETNLGQDKNGDGDYVDEGESLPMPDVAPAEFYGKKRSYVLQHTTQKILDFSVTKGGGIVGVTLARGQQFDDKNPPTIVALQPSYRTLAFNGLPLNFADATSGLLPLGNDAYPRWVSVIRGASIRLNEIPTTLSLALVALQQPNTNGAQQLAVIDISLPESPRLLNKIPVPVSLLGGSMESITVNSDGTVDLAGGQHRVVFNVASLGITNVPLGQLHPAIVEFVPDAGAGSRSVGTTEFGVRSVAEGGRSVVVQSPPKMVFVSFPNNAAVVNPAVLSSQNPSNTGQIMAGMRPTGALAPARARPEPSLFLESDLDPVPNPALHFHVLMFAPGTAGRQIELGLESLNPAGRPLSNPGQGYAPVRAISAAAQVEIGQVPRPNCGADIRPLPAYRVSDDPHSEFYNWYLSRPFALVTETISSADLVHLQNSVGFTGGEREILFSGAQLRAFIDSDQATAPDAGPVIGSFAAQIDRRKKRLDPISTVKAITVNRDYIAGDNPPPPGGATPFEDTYGTIQSHSGELRTTDVDLSVPGPRMSMAIFRVIGNQDTYEGPFGVGWDFNYNQRLTVLDPLTFPEGLRLPLVVRSEVNNSEVAGSQDVLFNDGQGQIHQFVWKSTDMPAEYAQDPLVQEFDYQNTVSDYYLPKRGMFNLLVKFKSGQFERLTPSGVRYRYSPSGRLESIIDTFPANRHDLQYDRNGWLVRIDDRSVVGPHFIEFGHYRRDSDPDFIAGLDEVTANSFVEGLICRLRDHTGRDVLFRYDDNGFLVNRQDVEVSGENGGFSGRAQTFYTYVDCRLASISASAEGTPYVSAQNTINSRGKPVAQATTGNYDNKKLEVEVENKASTVSDQATGVEVADGTTITRTFDELGNVTTTTISGGEGPPVSETRSHNPDGLLLYIRHPEGNSETRVYDSANPIFRSRGNLKQMTVDPGPRGGQGYTILNNYDPRYNLPSGEQLDANGFRITIRLRSDGRDIEETDYGNGARRLLQVNEHGQVVKKVNEDGKEESMTYDSATGFMKTRSVGDITYIMGYDGSIAAKLGRPTSVTWPMGAPTLVKYDNRLQTLESSRGEMSVKSAYDELGREILREENKGDGRKLITEYTFDAKGFITRHKIGGIEIEGTDGSTTTFFEPDDRSRVAKTILPNGTEQTYSYDARGNIVKTTLGDYSIETEYDLNNNPVRIKQGGDLVQSYVYDGLDRATSVVEHTGTADYLHTRTYYPQGELRSHVVTDPDFGIVRSTRFENIDALGRQHTSQRDGNLVSPLYTFTFGELTSQSSGPRMTKTIRWDKAGNVISYSDPNLDATIHRDGNGRVERFETQEDGARYELSYTYDDMDHQKTFSDLLGLRYAYEPRADGNWTMVTDARGNATTMEHTALGELQRSRRADGMEVSYRRDSQRQVKYQGDSEAGFGFQYDSSLRLKTSTLRNGARTTVEAYDPRNMPTSISIPGGTETRKYDLQARMIERKQTFLGRSVEHLYTYDAIGRIRSLKYGQIGAANNQATFDYDPAGPLVATRSEEDSRRFDISYGLYPDGSRRTITYPSGVVVTEIRDETGRLTGVSDAGGNIINAVSWQGNVQPKVVDVGSTMAITYQYDARGRVTASRAIRKSDGSVIAHMRFDYDPANNIRIRQFIHRGGRADLFAYDEAERVSNGKIGLVLTNIAGLGLGAYERHYNYDLGDKDLLVSANLGGAASRAPPFATNWSGHDSFLSPQRVDGFSRGLPDPKGNVTSAQVWMRPDGAGAALPTVASLEHDGLGRLTRLDRDDGVRVRNQYRPGGIRFSKTVSVNGSTTDDRAFVYDSSGRLLEEYDRSVTPPRLLGRYYYATADAPVAADLRDAGGEMRRHYYLCDPALSIVAVADASGTVVERVWYDTFGQPAIEQRDERPPAISRVLAGGGGSLLLAMSEPVQFAWVDPGAGAGIVAFNDTIAGAVSLLANTNTITINGTTTVEANVPGYPAYSVLRFTPSAATTGAVTLTLTGGSVSDEWGNTNSAFTVVLTNNSPSGTVFYQAASQTATAPTALARSSVGSPFLFHGQYFDYESGLIYLRARWYDPFSGMFFEPDPLGYNDGVNHYAAMANNPVSFRDPTGLYVKSEKPHLSARQMGEHASILRSHGYSKAEIDLYRTHHQELANAGFGDKEIAAHVRVMYQEHLVGRNWDLGVRSFDEKAAIRRDLVNRGFATKPEWVYDKTAADGVVRPTIKGIKEKKDKSLGETGHAFAGDIDGFSARINNHIAHHLDVNRFQDAVNKEIGRISNDFNEFARSEGVHVMQKGEQLAYQHGISMNIPQEVGTDHGLSPSGKFGWWAINEINVKMKKGIGNVFSFSFTGENAGFRESVNVNQIVSDYRNYYTDVMFNPKMDGKGYDKTIHERRIEQLSSEGALDKDIFPTPFGPDYNK